MYHIYALLHADDEAVFSLPMVGLVWIGFLFTFLMLGAGGFYFAVLRRTRSLGDDVRRVMAKRAAWLGSLGAVGQIVVFYLSVWGAYTLAAADDKAEVLERMTAPLAKVQILALVVAAVVYAIAVKLSAAPGEGNSSSGTTGVGGQWAWELATFAAIVAVLRNLLRGHWAGMVNPLHEFAGGLWIGTLFVLLVVGIGTVMRREQLGASRGKVVAELVHAFSPFAVMCVVLLALMGILTALHHIKHVPQLWTSSYGIVFLVKLAFALLVFALGAWNWQGVRPTLGDQSSAERIQRSARREVTVAVVVLIVTAVLVSLPAPK